MTRLNTCENCGKYEWSCKGRCMEYTRDQYIRDFADETLEMLNLTRRKNHDYGGETDPFKNFREFGELGILVRMSDKFARLKTVLSERRDLKVTDETIDDTIRDLAVYTIILKLWRKAHKNQKTEQNRIKENVIR